ncbi:MAG: hypothetical protein RR436_02950 [Clostridia bacterium]
MKWFSKINRGVILTAVILIGVIIYLVSLSVMQSGDKAPIEKVCKDYIASYNKYQLLPKVGNAEKPAMSQDELNVFFGELENELKPYFLGNTGDTVIKNMKENLKNQAKGIDVVHKYEKEVISINNITFNKATAVVNLTTHTTFDGPSHNLYKGDGSMPTKREEKSGDTRDEIRLAKENGKWYITSAYLLTSDKG